MPKLIDLTGRRFGKLTVIGIANKKKNGKDRHRRWLCKCDCGNDVVVATDKLNRGDTKSCGCLKIEISKEKIIKYGKPNIKHGKSRTRIYNIYNHMTRRCFDKKDQNYINYGGRGVTVCREWKNDFSAFYKWSIENGYKEYLTIDRIDNNGNYCPENCRWATNEEQQNNKRNNVFIEINGLKMTISQVAKKAGLSEKAMWWRVKNGWSGKDLLLPKNKRRKNNENKS